MILISLPTQFCLSSVHSIRAIGGLCLITYLTEQWKYRSGHVACPGGHVEEHESPYQACLREVQEEVGLDLEAERSVNTRFEMPQNEVVSYR